MELVFSPVEKVLASPTSPFMELLCNFTELQKSLANPKSHVEDFSGRICSKAKCKGVSYFFFFIVLPFSEKQHWIRLQFPLERHFHSSNY